MPFKEPFVLGPFFVDIEGRLSPAHADVAPRFSVRWRDRVVHARLAAHASGGGSLTIVADLGRIPSTVSGLTARAAGFAAMRALAKDLPAAWTPRLLPDHQQRLEVETLVRLPVTVACLVTEITAFLLDLSPFLDRMDAAGEA